MKGKTSMSREQRKQVAQETLQILRQGFYIAPSGRRVDIADAQKRSEHASYLIDPVAGQRLIGTLRIIMANEQDEPEGTNATHRCGARERSSRETWGIHSPMSTWGVGTAHIRDGRAVRFRLFN